MGDESAERESRGSRSRELFQERQPSNDRREMYGHERYEPKPRGYQINDKVLIQGRKRQENWYAGTVLSVNRDGTYSVRYDDRGHVWDKCPPSMIKRDEWIDPGPIEHRRRSSRRSSSRSRRKRRNDSTGPEFHVFPNSTIVETKILSGRNKGCWAES